jgi:two-component system chemotaxis sensor kinase CheA
MSSESTALENLKSLVAQLSEAAGNVEPDDLSRLAKMHGWCDSMMAATGPESLRPEEFVFAGVQAVSLGLESIILDEAPNAIAALEEVRGGIEELAKLLSTGMGQVGGSSTPSDTAPAEAGESAASPSDEQMAPPAAADVDGDAFAQPAAMEPAADTAALLAGEGTGDPGTSNTASDESAAAPFIEPQDVSPACDQIQEAEQELATSAAGPAEEPAAAATEDVPEAYSSEPLILDPKEYEFVQAFVEEASEHIESVEQAVLEVERDPGDAEQIDSLFRPFHTIKGMAGFLNLRDINCLTHEVETLLDQGRKGKREVTPGTIDLIFDVVDILKAQINAVGAYISNPTGEPVAQPPVGDMIGYLRQVVAGDVEPESKSPSAGSPDKKIGENLVEQGATTAEVVGDALERQQEADDPKHTGELLVEMGAVTPRQVSQAIRPQSQAKGTPAVPSAPSTPTPPVAAATEASVRIETAKLDALVDMVGELVIAQTQVNANPQVGTEPKLSKDVSQVTKIVRDVQAVAMSMRMIPIGGTFQKMARLVRDVSRKAGKKVELIISGEDTELDKNVIQQISDPLVHMVRNAVDHGIETPEAREAAGKDSVGKVHLAAYHQGGNIVIEINDDGKGLDPAALQAKAIEKGIIQPGDELTESQTYNLIFAPGFSTAAVVTDISGRGVGMDVVKRNLEQLRGKVDITSRKGEGSTFSIRLPLTLAIIDGMVVKVDSERFIIPTINIEQALRPLPDQITTVQQKGEVLNVRGRLVPLVPLNQIFGFGAPVSPCDAMVVIAQADGSPVGVVVDELLGQQQVVIKTLGERFQKLRGISGAAILGDGRIGLILEMSGLLSLHTDRRLAKHHFGSSLSATALAKTAHREVPTNGTNGQSAAEDQAPSPVEATDPQAADVAPDLDMEQPTPVLV